VHKARRCPACYPSWGSSTRRPTTTAAYQRLRLWVFAEQDYLCAWPGCGRLAVELDHIVAVSDGGGDEPENLQGLCVEHHRAKTQAESRRGAANR
jgi:5-methylcytosine-specific restriction endonuclease McrA